MLAFRVIKLEQCRALQQNTAKMCFPEFRNSELSFVTRSSSGPKLSKLNRQIPELEHPVTSRKQTAEACSNCSNRQKMQKRLRPISASVGFLSAQDFASSDSRKTNRPTRENEVFLQSGLTISNRFWPKNRNFQISAAAELRLRQEAPRTFYQSSNLSRSYGRP